MYKHLVSTLFVATLLSAQPTFADQAKAQAAGCMACHQVAAKVVGPSYQDVATKYKGNADAKAMLIGKVRNGGVGTWGQIPMPPNAVVSDEDLAAIMDWILAL